MDAPDTKTTPPFSEAKEEIPTGEQVDLVNTSGHVQEVDRTFGFWSVCTLAIVTDNAWGAGGGSLVVSLYNGGGPGVMYELVASVVFYSLIGLALAELASALPSSANVYHWASITAGRKYGRFVSFYAGWWNALAWIFGTASASLFGAETLIAMYSVWHPDYVLERWHIFIAYVLHTWLCLSMVLFGQKYLARGATVMGVLLLILFVVVTLTCAILPSQTGYGYASNAFVWKDFQNLTGWKSDGLVFILGILNGAFTIGTPDIACHLCEEAGDPRKTVPYGILMQMSVGSVTSFIFYLSILYAVTDFTAVFNGRITALPVAAMFQQVTRSNAGTFALLFLFYIDEVLSLPGSYTTAGRMVWTLARDDAVPFSAQIRKVDRKWRNPFNAQLACGIIVTVLGAIYVGNATAFTAFVGCFVILTTWSYVAAMLPHLLTGRRHVNRGPFWMPTVVHYLVSGTACAYILIFNVLYMFPYDQPVTVANMNYACVMSGGLTILLTFWYLYIRKNGYEGPHVVLDGRDDILQGIAGLTKEEEDAMRRASAH